VAHVVDYVSTALTAMITLFVVGLVPLAPTEPVLIGMGVLAASGTVPLPVVIAVSAVACSMSDHLLYAFGRLAGARALARFGRRPSVLAATDWLSQHITRWGAPILVVGRWLPAGGTIGAVLTGTLRWRLARFTPASVVGSTLWSTYVALIGFLGGTLTGTPAAGLIVSLVVATVIGIASGVLLRRAHRASVATELNEEPLVVS
jgi:membrane protein DedA with SNARE-associated domain